jgi:peptidyl-prolyl cis-trans isomerase A (cyclophilin A)
MKRMIPFALAAVLVAASLWAQNESKPAPTPTAQPDPALMNPSALQEQAPAVYKVKFTTTKGDFVVEVTRAWSPHGADRFS